MQEFNPHLPFGDHLLGNFFCFFTRTKGFFTFYVVYIRDEGFRKVVIF
jgi:hypothetical protein